MPSPPPPPGGPRGRDDDFRYDPGDTPSSPSRQVFENRARTWGMLCHLSALCMYVGVPFGNLAGPLLVWLLKRNEFPYVDEQGKESLNFQISISIYGILAAILLFVFIGFILLFALAAFQLVMVIIAAVKANDGNPIRYPLTIRFLK